MKRDIHDIFISYRREGGVDLAARINDALKARGYSVFMDIEDLKSGRFNVALLEKIAEATDVLVILTQGCLERCRNEGDWLLREVEHAIRQERNVVPVMTRSFVRPAAGELPSVIYDLLEYHGITSQPEMFDECMVRLTRLLKSRPAEVEGRNGDATPRTAKVGSSFSGIVQAPTVAHPDAVRMAVLKIVSDPPGAHVVIDGGVWETTAGNLITKVSWGSHDYFATLGEEEIFGAFDINASPYILKIAFPIALERLAEAAAEEALWSRTVATASEEVYCTYLAESRLRTHQAEAEAKLEEFRGARALREEAERQRLEREAAEERARLEAERHEQELWDAATAKDTETAYAAYAKASRLGTHRPEAEARVLELRAALARQKEERREKKLWAAASEADSEDAYASYLADSQLLAHRAEATARLEELRAERARREEEARRRREKLKAEALARQEEERREQALWGVATKANTEQSYASYLAESRLLAHRPEAERSAAQLRDARIRKEEEDRRRREADERARHARQAAELLEPVLWVAATEADSSDGYRTYLKESVLLLHKQVAEERLAQFQAARLHKEAEKARIEREQQAELARKKAQEEDRQAWERATKADTEEAYRTYLAHDSLFANKAEGEARLARLRAERLRREAEDATPAGTERTLSLAPGVDLTMCWVPATTSSQWKRLSAGTDVFLMGSPKDEEHRGSDETLHPVKLTKGFWMGKYPVTAAQWTAVMGKPPYSTNSGGSASGETWNACVKFIEKLNERIAGGGFRLPTEAEWEYACRAGRTGPYAWAYEQETSRVLGVFKTHKTVAKDTNPWNIRGMYARMEWCSDVYGSYPSGLAVDPVAAKGEKSGERVRRGAWFYHKHSSGLELARIAERSSASPGERSSLNGFRLARTNPVAQDDAWPKADDAEMVKYYRKAAEQGNATAQFNLGVMYDNGRGVAKDDAEAVKWYRKAAEKGDSDAQYNLGWMYANGRGVAKDDTEAAKWYRKAAAQGQASARTNLDAMCRAGRASP